MRDIEKKLPELISFPFLIIASIELRSEIEILSMKFFFHIYMSKYISFCHASVFDGYGSVNHKENFIHIS